MLTQKRLKEVLHYDPKTGIFKWIISKNPKIKIGDIAGTKLPNQRIQIQVDGKFYKASRLAWLYMESYFPEHEIDHKDKIKDNDKWNNLRHITRLCNQRNVGLLKNNTSGVTGVTGSEKWMAQIGINNKIIYLGVFHNFINAVKARYKAEVENNWPDCQTTSSAYLYLKERNLL